MTAIGWWVWKWSEEAPLFPFTLPQMNLLRELSGTILLTRLCGYGDVVIMEYGNIAHTLGEISGIFMTPQHVLVPLPPLLKSGINQIYEWDFGLL